MKVINHRDETLVLKDGVELKARLWIPNKGGPWPTLLMRQPYGREIASTVTYAHPSWFSNNGFLVVVQDVRGQGDSKGDFSGFSQEGLDTSKTLEWTRSLPECNGKVGTYGFSYQGLTQLLAIPGTPPPDCLAPAMTGLNEKDHWSVEGDAFWWHIGLSWGLQLAAQRLKRAQDWDGWIEIRKSLENGTYLRDGPKLLARYDPQGMAIKWLKQSNNCTQNWIIHKPLKTWLEKPMLLIGGWYDPHLRGIIDIYRQSLKAGGKPEIHIGPATHLQWWEGIHELQLNFFNRYLKNPENLSSKKTTIQLWNLTTKCWQHSKKFPEDVPSWGLKTEGSSCFLNSDGLLESSSEGSGMAILVHDPWRPIPSIGGHLGPEPGEADRGNIDKRNDVATFSSAQLPKSLYLEGNPFLEVEVFANQKGFDLCVALSIVNQEKTKVTQLSTGYLRVLGGDALKPLLRKVELFPFSAEFKKGTSLRISISGSAWPAIAVNPGNDDQPCQAPGPNCLVTTIYLKLDKSKLEISPLISP